MHAVLADDEDGYAKLFYGLANFAAGDYGAAATAFRRALQTAPDLIDDPIDLRTFYQDESTLAAQLTRLSEFANARPGDQETRFLLGYLYFATGDPEKALTALRRVSDAVPADSLTAFVRDAATRVLNPKEAQELP